MTNALRRLAHSRRYVGAATRLDLQRRAQYRGELWVWSSASVLQICVSLAVWRVVAGSGTVGGYDSSAIIGYFLVLLVVREATYSGVPWAVEDDIVDGKFTAQLVRPVHPLLGAYATAAAFRYVSLLLIVPIAIGLFFLFDATIEGGWRSIAIAIALIPFANVVRMYADGLVSCASLWIVKIGGPRQAYFLVMLFLGGQFAPLDVLPDTLQTIAKALPFYWFLGFPVELAIGRQPLGDAWIGFAVLLAWGLVLHLLLRVVWKRGVRAHESVGT